MLREIRNYVISERASLGISSVDRSSKLELSGEMADEFAMLLDRQLLTTEFGYGGWHALEHPQVLEGVYHVVKRRQTRSRTQ